MVIDKEKIQNIAQKYVLKGQSDKAIKEYQKLIKASPRDSRAHLKLGDLYLKGGENEKAIGEYLKVAELYVEDDLSYRAISVYKKVLSIDPKHIEALHRIARLYLKEGLRGDARNYYQSILKIRPNDQEAMNALKGMEDQQGQKEVSRRIPSAEPPPSKPRPLPERRPVEAGTHPVGFSPMSPAGASVEAEIPSPDKDAEMHYHLGIAYKEMELYDYAISEFELASENVLRRFDCCIMLGDCYMEKGSVDRAIGYYRAASEIEGLSDDKLARLHFHLGCAYEANGMTAEAINAFTLVLKLDRSVSEAYDRLKKLQQSSHP